LGRASDRRDQGGIQARGSGPSSTVADHQPRLDAAAPNRRRNRVAGPRFAWE
jgi:hypothetical protein